MVVSSIHDRGKDDVENVLRSFKEWMKNEGHAPSRPDRTQLGDGSSPRNNSNSSRTSSPLGASVPSRPPFDIPMGSKSRPTIVERVLRTFISGCVVLAVAGVGWQAYEDPGTRTLIFSAANWSVNWLSAVLSSKSTQPATLSATATPKLGDEGSAQSAGTSVADKQVPPELQQSLETMAADIAAVRAIVEDLARKQENTAKDVAQLQASEQAILQKITSLTQAATAAAHAQKKPPKPARLDSQAQPASVPLPVAAPRQAAPDR